jgi:hybrid cluster-associated redox disulfide protein
MNTRIPTPATTVEEVFQNFPEAGPVFMAYHTGCLGCWLARFCTLAEVANIYEINLLSFLADLQQNAQSANNERSET